VGTRAVTAILLDTNALLWLVSAPDRVAPNVLDTLAYQANELYVSAVSAWEVAIKTRIGRLDGATLLSAWNETLASMNAVDLVIDSADATMAGQLNWNHKDPFDRMIVTQAARRSLTIATSDTQLIEGALTPVIDTRAEGR
jgi:PIN domain nuclease of toxin-antitoxin system